MGVITDLKQSRNRNRINVYIDGEYSFGLARILTDELRINQALSYEQIEGLRRRDMEETSYRRALRLISRRPRSEYELRVKFDQKQVPPEVQDAVLIRLRELDLVDDMAFAEAWVENRRVFRPRSALALRAELRKKGVSPEVIEAALEDHDDEYAGYQAAVKAARRWKGLGWSEFQQHVGAYLVRRGFSYSIIHPVVARVWRETIGAQNESEVSK